MTNEPAHPPRRPGLRGWLSPDLVLLHAPALYDFRRQRTLFGPVSDVVPSSAVFEMYPVGWTSLAESLEREGFNVRIVNLAYRMMRDPRFDVEAKLRRLRPVAFGVDLHWLVHAQGALALAELVKHVHPDTPVILGGLSASYFHRELVRYPQVDMVLRGDSTEAFAVDLMRVLCFGGSLADVSNLTWKDAAGTVVENPRAPVPAEATAPALPSFRYVVRSVLRNGSLADVVPYAGWLRDPMTGLVTSRGCLFDCALCGGSRSAYRTICGRERPMFRSADGLVRDLRTIQAFSRAAVVLLNDIRMGGPRRVDRFFELAKAAKIRNEIVFELFAPAGLRFFSAAEAALPRFSVQISLESHRQDLRRRLGKFACPNEAVERTVRCALEHGARRVDLFFMIGIPGQTYRDAVEAVDYGRRLWEIFDNDRRVQLFVAPLTPFLDPGSPGFEQPERHGYRVRWRTLEEHRRALEAPTWKQMLNYETDAMSRDEIVAATYECYDRLAALKRDVRRVDDAAEREVRSQTRKARALIAEIDRALALREGPEREERIRAARARIDGLREQKSPTALELHWPTARAFAPTPSLVALIARSAAAEVRRLVTKRLPLWLGGRLDPSAHTHRVAKRPVSGSARPLPVLDP